MQWWAVPKLVWQFTDFIKDFSPFDLCILSSQCICSIAPQEHEMAATALRSTSALNSIPRMKRERNHGQGYASFFSEKTHFPKNSQLMIPVFHWPETDHMFTPKPVTAKGKRVTIIQNLAWKCLCQNQIRVC